MAQTLPPHGDIRLVVGPYVAAFVEGILHEFLGFPLKEAREIAAYDSS